MQEPDEHQDEIFKIGSVSRLTGLSTHILRKWESRYGAIVPMRTARGERGYTRDDVERLSLIKRLVDSGSAPRDVARLSHAELTRKSEQLAELETAAGARRKHPLRAAVVGDAIAVMFEPQSATESFVDVVASTTTAADHKQIADAGPFDVLIYECPIVTGNTRREVEELRERISATAAVVVYRFGTRADLLTLQSAQLTTLRAPAEPRVLGQVITQLLDIGTLPHGSLPEPDPANDTVDEVPAPRLSREAVASLSRSTPEIRCECPHHLADIVLSLRAFEDYSEACESLSPEDAVLHHLLWRCAAQARALFEDAIEHVAEAEGISLDG
jgi:MerR family transcriptional regulator, light-induced transcriptional regulator